MVAAAEAAGAWGLLCTQYPLAAPRQATATRPPQKPRQWQRALCADERIHISALLESIPIPAVPRAGGGLDGVEL